MIDKKGIARATVYYLIKASFGIVSYLEIIDILIISLIGFIAFSDSRVPKTSSYEVEIAFSGFLEP